MDVACEWSQQHSIELPMWSLTAVNGVWRWLALQALMLRGRLLWLIAAWSSGKTDSNWWNARRPLGAGCWGLTTRLLTVGAGYCSVGLL